jgi:hypothetical protein
MVGDTESLEPVHAFPLAEEHRAYNLADLLEEAGISATVLYGACASVSEAEAVLVAVPTARLDDARDLTERFLANYPRAIDVLLARRHMPSWGMRLLAVTYFVLIPVAVIVGSLHSLWKALLRLTAGTPHPGLWHDQDLGIGIIGVIFAAGYVGAVLYVFRRSAS